MLIPALALAAGCGQSSNVTPNAAPTMPITTVAPAPPRPTTSPSSSTAASDAPVVVAGFRGEGSTEFCAALRRAVESAPGGQPLENANPSQLQATMAERIRIADDFQALAPEEIRPDLLPLVRRVHDMDAYFARFGYDQDRAQRAAEADPTIGAEMNAQDADPASINASARVRAYETQVCGLQHED